MPISVKLSLVWFLSLSLSLSLSLPILYLIHISMYICVMSMCKEPCAAEELTSFQLSADQYMERLYM
jgi:hypothetical protein